MNLENYIQKLLENLTGLFVKIFGTETLQGKRAQRLAEQNNCKKGFFVRTKNYSKNSYSQKDIQDEVISILKNPKTDYSPGMVIGQNTKYDNPNYRFIFLEKPSRNPDKIRKFFVLIFDQTQINNIIIAVDAAIKQGKYFIETSKFQELQTIGQSIVYTQTEFENFLKTTKNFINTINDGNLKSSIQSLYDKLPKLENLISVDFQDSPSKREETISRGGFIGTATIIDTPEGTELAFPKKGIQGIIETKGSGQGVFIGDWNEKGLPENGEIWYAEENFLGKQVYDVTGLSEAQEDAIRNTTFIQGSTYGGKIYFKGELYPSAAGDIFDPNWSVRFKNGELHSEKYGIYEGTFDEKGELVDGTLWDNTKTRRKQIFKNGNPEEAPEEIKRKEQEKIEKAAAEKRKIEKEKTEKAATKKRENDQIKNKKFTYPLTDKRVEQITKSNKPVYLDKGMVYYLGDDAEIYNTTKEDFEEVYKNIENTKKLQRLKPGTIPPDIKNKLLELSWKSSSGDVKLYKLDQGVFKPQQIKPKKSDMSQINIRNANYEHSTYIPIKFKYKGKIYDQFWIQKNLIK